MTTDPRDALPPRLDPACTCVCHSQPGVMHVAPCCREADPRDAEIADRLQLIARSLPDGVSKKSCEMINAGGEAIARLLAEIARLHQQWEDQDAAWSERVAVLSAALAESEAATEGALMILVQTQAERDAALAQVAAERGWEADRDSLATFKRGMKGVYQHCGKKHLHRYMAEFDFRYSNRATLDVSDVLRADKALLGVIGKRLKYEGTRSNANGVAA